MGWGEGCIEDVLQLQLSILSQVGVYFLGRGTNRRLWAAQQPEASFVGGDVFRQSTSAALNLPPQSRKWTYVRQRQQIGET